MKSILFIALLAFAATACDTPENSTGSDTMPPAVSSDSAMTSPDTMMGTPMDTTGSMPMDTTQTTP